MKKLLLLVGVLAACGAAADQVGEVDTVFKFIGPDHKIVVDAHDDPAVGGVTCYVSRAKTGGIKGALKFILLSSSGGGGLLRRIADWAGRRVIAVQLTGIDMNPHAARAASRSAPDQSRASAGSAAYWRRARARSPWTR